MNSLSYKLIAGIIIINLGLLSCEQAPQKKSEKKQEKEVYEPPFTKEGELTFWMPNGTDQVRKIDIEYARTEKEITDGMMFRRNVPDTQGMLFVFPNEEPRSFWMKNTLVSLDLIFINADQEIVSIQEKAAPKDRSSLPSEKPAKYVLEVIGGFCETYDIGPGYFVTFTGA